jgi:predicted phosphodiesterase
MKLAIIGLFAVPTSLLAHVPGRVGDVELRRGPYVQALLQTSVELRWTTNIAVRGGVRCRGADGLTVEAREDGASDVHRVLIQGLSPGTLYTYEVLAGDAVLAMGDNLRFRTSPPPGQGAFRAVVLGDSGIGRGAQLDVADLAASFDPDLFLHTGDMLYVADVDYVIFEPYCEILPHACFYPVMGNHDSELQFLGIAWRDIFTVPNDTPGRPGVFYSYDYGPAHFVGLDYFASFAPESSQRQFLLDDLADARARGVQWLIVYLHVPVYTRGVYAHLDDDQRRDLPKICDDFDVDLVFSGHDHNYQRSYPVRERQIRDGYQDPHFVQPRGTIYVVTGGGGQITYPEIQAAPDRPFVKVFESLHHAVELLVTPTRLEVRAWTPGPDSRLLDEFTVSKEPPRPEIEFLRGDADFDGFLAIGDPIRTLNYLFIGGSIDCPAVADADASGSPLQITDAIHTLLFLFLGGPPPAAPYPDCGPAVGANDAQCLESGCI